MKLIHTVDILNCLTADLFSEGCQPLWGILSPQRSWPDSAFPPEMKLTVNGISYCMMSVTRVYCNGVDTVRNSEDRSALQVIVSHLYNHDSTAYQLCMSLIISSTHYLTGFLENCNEIIRRFIDYDSFACPVISYHCHPRAIALSTKWETVECIWVLSFMSKNKMKYHAWQLRPSRTKTVGLDSC
jgi:hypothetical protein